MIISKLLEDFVTLSLETKKQKLIKISEELSSINEVFIKLQDIIKNNVNVYHDFLDSVYEDIIKFANIMYKYKKQQNILGFENIQNKIKKIKEKEQKNQFI